LGTALSSDPGLLPLPTRFSLPPPFLFLIIGHESIPLPFRAFMSWRFSPFDILSYSLPSPRLRARSILSETRCLLVFLGLLCCLVYRFQKQDHNPPDLGYSLDAGSGETFISLLGQDRCFWLRAMLLPFSVCQRFLPPCRAFSFSRKWILPPVLANYYHRLSGRLLPRYHAGRGGPKLD